MNIGLVHVIHMIYPAVRRELYCLWKQLFASGSIIEVKQKSFKHKSWCRAPTLVQLNNRYCNRNLIGTANFLAVEVTV